MSGITRSAMIFTNYYRIQNILEYAGEGPLSSPGIRSRATTWTLQKMPDIVDIGTRETAEIKSTRQVQLAVAENTADTITRNMESSIGGYHGLTNYSGMESFGQALRLSWTTPRPGAVTYSWEIQDDNGDWNEASAAALAARRTDIWRQLREKLRSTVSAEYGFASNLARSQAEEGQPRMGNMGPDGVYGPTSVLARGVVALMAGAAAAPGAGAAGAAGWVWR